MIENHCLPESFVVTKKRFYTNMTENQSQLELCSITCDMFVEEAKLGKHRRCHEIPEMNHVVYDEPPIGTARPGIYHPLCCYVLSQYYFNGSRLANLPTRSFSF